MATPPTNPAVPTPDPAQTPSAAELQQVIWMSTDLVIQHLRSASTITAQWLHETGEQLSRNLDTTRHIQDSMRATSISLSQVDKKISSTQENINTLNATIKDEEHNLASAYDTLHDAREELDRAEATHNSMHIAVSLQQCSFHTLLRLTDALS